MNEITSSLFIWMGYIRLILYVFLIYSLLSLAFSKPTNGKGDYSRFIHVLNAAIFAVLGLMLLFADFWRNHIIVHILRDYALTGLLIGMTAVIWYSMITDARKEVELKENNLDTLKEKVLY